MPEAPKSPASPNPPSGPESPNPWSDPAFASGLRPIPTGGPGGAQPSAGRPAADVVGVGPEGDAISIELDHLDGGKWLLLAFLATSCDGCDTFWRGLGPDDGRPGLPPQVTPVIVTRGPTVVDRDVVHRLAQGSDVAVVMSDEAWEDYRVLGYPFLVLVDRSTCTIAAESVAFGWDDLLELVDASSS